MTKLDNLLETIYDKYVNIKMTLNNLLPEDPSKIQNEFSDKVYSLEDLDKTIQQKKSLIYDDKKFVYGEITKSGVETIQKEICKHNKGIDTFIDVGSGVGKICLHMSLISDFENIVGVEIVTGRHVYAVELIERLEHDFNNVILLNDDILQFDFEKPVVVFTNDVCFPIELTQSIWNILPVGSHFITYKIFGPPLSKILLDVTWSNSGTWFNYYIKT